VQEQDHEPGSRVTTAGGRPEGSTNSSTAQEATNSAKQGAQQVAGTVREQTQQMAGEIGHQARSVVHDLRGSVAGQASQQNDRLAQGLRTMADQLSGMAKDDDNSAAGQVVRRLGETGRQAADYLERQGPEGLLDDVQEFARRRPGTFLLAAAAAGFLVGRLGRTAVSATRSGDGGTSGGGPAGSADEVPPPATTTYRVPPGGGTAAPVASPAPVTAAPDRGATP
jgi:hypothetical protein